ncbi:MAG: proprotein convertase P-domain-containing protein, partial [Anaerolinea sp.]|nr:proprotein convertase P-domain-containing protein [Anaerolinea sp.]
MQRKRFVYLLAILALLVSMLPLAAAAQEGPTASFQIEEFAAADDKALAGSAAAGAAPFYAPDGMNLFSETEPNDTAATANALAGSQAVVLGSISPAGDYDYFSFSANAGDRVYAAVQTQWSNASGDSRLDVMASDGVTSLEFDDDSGSFGALSSAIGGAIIPATGTYYVRVYGYTATTVITPYHLHVRVQSGTPTAEVEPNNDLATATPLAASQWMSGTITATTDPDYFSFALNAGDSVFLGLDMDPGRVASNTTWNGRLGMGLFGGAGNMILVANDGSTTKPHAEAFFMTVQQAGTYFAYVDSTSTAGLGPNARYHLSVSIYPKATQQNCTTFTSSDVPKAIGPGVGTTTSTITVPGAVTSSITDINATIVLTHTNMPDLDVSLVSPTAVNVPLFTDVGVNTQTVMNVGMDDQAALPIGPFTVVAGMINQPEQPGRLASFNGAPATGTWTLQVADDAASNGGVLQSWSLEICGNPPPPYAIELNKTVGLVPAVCATTDSVAVPPGGFDVYYCYTVRNTGLNTVNTHDLVDSELGTIFTGMNLSLAPGATYSHIVQATVYDTVTNTGAWTAYDGQNSASDSDTATVTVRAQQCPVGYQPVTLDYSFFDNPFPPAGWSVTNTTTNCNAAGAVPEWTNTNPGNRVNLTGGVGPFAIGDSDKCGSGSLMDTIMTTGALDFTGLVSPTLSYNTDYYDLSGTAGAQALVDVSTDGGGSWTNLLTWNGSHRGPLLVTQPLTGAAGQSNVQVRWHYAQAGWDYWWQVDSAFITACEPIPSNPAITLDKTVGTDPTVCAATDQITVAAGTDVTYCYEVTNTGDVSFNTHDLVDSELGALLTNYPYTLTPGASAFITETATINVTTVNTATWTASTLFEGGGVSASDVATVTVMLDDPNIYVDPLSMASTQPPNVQMQQTLTISNTGGGMLNWSIVEEPASAPPAAAPENVTGSTLSAVAPTALMPGVPTTLSFTARFVSPDLEYGDRFDVDLPDGWTIGAVSANSSPMANGCSSAIPPVSGVAAGNVVYWQSKSTLPTGCGAWNGGSAGANFTFTVEVTAPSCSGAPWDIPWNIIGDGYGAAPHSVSGVFSSVTCAQPPPTCTNPADVPWLSPSTYSGANAGGTDTDLTVGFDSTGMAAGTYNANLCIDSDDPDPGPGNETDLVIVPVTMTVTQPLAPNIDVSPLSLSETHATPPQSTSQTLTVANTGGGTLTWSIAEEPAAVLVQPDAPNAAVAAPAAGATGSRGSGTDATAPIAYSSPADFSEGFDDITNLPGWYMQNNSSPL